MTRAEIIAILNEHAAELQARGVKHAALFGSKDRGDDDTTSDIDLAVTLDPKANLDGFDVAGLQLYLNELLGSHVDLVTEPVRKPDLAEEIEKDRHVAF